MKTFIALLILLPTVLLGQSLVSTGSEEIYVNPNTILYSVNGLEFKGSAINKLSVPQTFTFDDTNPADARVLMSNSDVIYQVRDVDNGETALFSTDAPYASGRTVAELSLVNQSATGDFNLRVTQTSHSGFIDIPLEWIITKSNQVNTDVQNLTFTWGVEAEAVTIPVKTLYFFNTTTNEWQPCTKENTTLDENTNTLTYTGFVGGMDNQRFMIASGLVVTDLQPFNFCPGIPSEVQTFSLSGVNLSETVTITAPAGFEIRETGDLNFVSMVALPIDGSGNLVTTSIDVRVAASARVSMTTVITILSGTDPYSHTVSATVAPPEIINVLGNALTIAAGDDTPDGADDTKFGTVTVNKPASRTYTIQNTGTRPLVVSGISLSGDDADLFAVGGIAFPAAIPVGGSTTFTVTITADSPGSKSATIVISSDDDCTIVPE